MPLGHRYVFFGKMSVWSLTHFLVGLSGFFLILSCVNYVYILDINAFSVASFANIFSHSESCQKEKDNFLLFKSMFKIPFSPNNSFLRWIFLFTDEDKNALKEYIFDWISKVVKSSLNTPLRQKSLGLFLVHKCE